MQLVDSETAVVQVRYSCTGGPEELALWVSVKQSANGSANPALAVEGSGYEGRATAWSQTHAAVADLRCDGKTHVGRFTVEREEYGYGALQRGRAYVQFCLFDATTVGEEGPFGEPVSSMEFVNVR